MRTYTTAALVENIQRRGAIPANQSTYEADEMIAIADDELQTMIVPAIMALKAAHFLTYVDYTTTTAVVYDIPATALNRDLQNVVFVAADGSETALTPIDFDVEVQGGDRSFFQYGAFYVRGDKLVLYPDSTAGQTLRLYYYRLPNRLVQTSEAAEVLSVDYDTNIITCSSVPADWAAGDSICCVSGQPGFDLNIEAADIVDVSSPTVELADASAVVAGDWLAAEGDSPIPQIPVETHPLLAQAALVKILEGLGDPRMKLSQEKLMEVMRNYQNVASPRVEQAFPKLISRKRLADYMG